MRILSSIHPPPLQSTFTTACPCPSSHAIERVCVSVWPPSSSVSTQGEPTAFISFHSFRSYFVGRFIRSNQSVQATAGCAAGLFRAVRSAVPDFTVGPHMTPAFDVRFLLLKAGAAARHFDAPPTIAVVAACDVVAFETECPRITRGVSGAPAVSGHHFSAWPVLPDVQRDGRTRRWTRITGPRFSGS